jgi:hypothetical protein
VVVESDRDATQGLALSSEAPNLGQCSLLSGVRFQMPAVCGKAEAKLDVPNALSLGSLVPQRVAGRGSLPSSLR